MKKRNTETVEKEYLTLREEIQVNSSKRDSTSQFAYTVCLAIYSVALTAKIEWLNLLILPFTLLISLKIAECCNCMSYLASYLYVIIENECDFKWEQRHALYYEKNPRRGLQHIIHYLPCLDMALLSFISSFLFWFMRWMNYHLSWFDFQIHGSTALGLLILLLQIITVVLEVYFCCSFAFFGKKKKTFIDNWERINEEIYFQNRKKGSRKIKHNKYKSRYSNKRKWYRYK